MEQIQPGSPAYNICLAFRLSGELNIEALEKSLSEIVRRHSILRTTFSLRGGEPVQIISAAESIPLRLVDVNASSSSEELDPEFVQGQQEALTPFDLARDFPFRASLLICRPDENILLLTFHHLAFDDWSRAVLFRELTGLYGAFYQKKQAIIPELPQQYSDFVRWQRDTLQAERLNEHLSYWKRQLADVPVMRLPTDRPRAAKPTLKGEETPLVLSKTLSEAVKDLSLDQEVTLFMLLMAAFKVLIQCYTGQEDIVVGTDSANRDSEEFEDLIGLFVDQLVFRTDISGNPPFLEILRRVKQIALEAYTHKDLPFEKLVEVLKPKRDLNRTPLFQIKLVFKNIPVSIPELTGLALSPLKTSSCRHLMDLFDISSGTAKHDLTLFLWDTREGIRGAFEYNADLFDSTTIETMADYFQALLQQIVAQPEARIHTLKTHTERERRLQTMGTKEAQNIQIHKLRTIKRKSVNLAELKSVQMDFLPSGGDLPLLIQSGMDEVDLVEWARNNKDLIQTKLLQHASILFRGFPIESIPDFEHFASAICPELFGEYGDLPREGVSGKVYGSTPYPSDQAILFHNESSHMNRWPLKIWFFCLKAAAEGGETPIVDCRKIYQLLDPAIRDEFAKRKLLYVRNYVEGVDVSWQEFFRTEDKTQVEVTCKQSGVNYEWREGNVLRTSKLREAIANHPITGVPVFFNQIQLHHISTLEPKVRGALLSMFKEEDLPRNVYFGDGAPIEDSVVDNIRNLYEKSAVRFSWKQGDILMLDNMLAAHGRSPFVGERKIVVTMGEMFEDEKKS